MLITARWLLRLHSSHIAGIVSSSDQISTKGMIMPLKVVTTTTLKHVGTSTEDNVFTITLKDGTVLHGIAIWPRYPNYGFALDPAFYTDTVREAIDAAYEAFIKETIESHAASLEENPNYFNSYFAALPPRLRAEHTVNRQNIEAVIVSPVEEGCPEVVVKIGYPYGGVYRQTITYQSPIAKLAVD